MKNTTLLFFFLMWSVSALANAKDFIYCVITDEYNNAAYFTEVFEGEYDALDQYEDTFMEQVVATYGDEVDPGVHCTFEEKRSMIIDEFERDVEDNRSFYDSVVTLELND